MTIDRANKPTIFFIHGGCQSTDLHSTIASLKNNHNLDLDFLAPELPGHGKEPQPKWEPTMLNLAEWVLLYCAKQGVSDVIFVAHSMGVRVALEAYALLKRGSFDLRQSPISPPLTIKALVFCEAMSFALLPSTNSDDLPENTASDSDFNDMLSTLVRSGCSHRTPATFVEGCIRHNQGMKRPYRITAWKSIVDFDLNRADEMFGMLREDRNTPVMNIQSTKLDGLKPAWLEEGEETDYMQYLKEQRPSILQVVVPDSGHWPMQDRPDFIAKEIYKFLKTAMVV